MPIFLLRSMSTAGRLGLGLLAVAILVAVATVGRWLPIVLDYGRATFVAASPSEPDSPQPAKTPLGAHDHSEACEQDADSGHGKPPASESHDVGAPKIPRSGESATLGHRHDDAAAVHLSPAAQESVRLRLVKVELQPFERTISVPGMVVERPGWSLLEVTAPMTGIVTQIYPLQGEAVEPDQPLFEVRLTHEDLLQLQTEFLRTLEELDVVQREVERLEKAAADGIVAGKTLLDRKYEQQKQQAALKTQRQALLLHGLTSEQIDAITAQRTLLQSLTIRAPRPTSDSAGGESHGLLQVQQLKAARGKYVNAGDVLCTLADHGELFIEGVAFEQDIPALNRAAASDWRVSALLGSKSAGTEETVKGLRLFYLDNNVDRESRTLRFYIALPNQLLREDKTAAGHRFVYWRFKPGQKVLVQVPVERWAGKIVLPIEAVVQEGPESYVFEANEGHFDRRSVRVEYRDQNSAVIANDGSLRVGAEVAASAAHQMQLLLKSKAGGGVDPHAGHNH